MNKRTLSVGKIRAIQRMSTSTHAFTILALDHQDSLRQAIDSQAPLSLSSDVLIAFKLDAIEALHPSLSGVLLDPVYGAAQSIQRGIINGIGLLVELEKADYEMQPLPLDVEIRPDWSVAKIKRMHADGVKIFFYYHPDETAHAKLQEALIQQVVQDCACHDIPLYAEPIAFAPQGGPALGSPEYAADRPRVVAESARRIAALGADVLKLEFPVDVHQQPDEGVWLDACRRVSDAVDVPWVLLSAGADYDAFCRQVEVACKGGAAGLIAGRAVWGEACALEAADARRRWFNQFGQPRMQALSDIVVEHARPWTDHLQPEAVSADWFSSYESGEYAQQSKDIARP